MALDGFEIGWVDFFTGGWIEVLLIVWLLRVMAPVRFSARYLVIPLLTVVESFVVERPEVTVRIVCGTILLAVGAGALLFWKARGRGGGVVASLILSGGALGGLHCE